MLYWRISLPAHHTVSRSLPIDRTLNVLRQPIAIALDRAGIFNLLSIAYAFRPRLRVRLTRGRRALPRNPWTFGEGDSHPLYRVLMPCIVTSMHSNAPFGTPSLHILRSPTAYIYSMYTRDFGSRFKPQLLSAQNLSIGELLRTL